MNNIAELGEWSDGVVTQYQSPEITNNISSQHDQVEQASNQE